MTQSERPDDYANRRKAVEIFLQTTTAEKLADPQTRKRMSTEAIMSSPDPMAREIGTQLTDGTLTTRQIASSRVYADLLRQGMQRMQGLNYARAVRAAIDADRKEQQQ